MRKPEGYESATAFTGEFETLPAGGYVCRIIKATVEQTKESMKDVLIILFDIAEGEYKDFYKKQFDRKKADNPDAKWQGIYRQLTEGKSLSFFKGMITAIENSNPGYIWDFDETKLKGKLFGGVFGQEEYKGNDGNIKLSTKCRIIRSVEQIQKGVDIPEIKKLAGNVAISSKMPEVLEKLPWDD